MATPAKAQVFRLKRPIPNTPLLWWIRRRLMTRSGLDSLMTIDQTYFPHITTAFSRIFPSPNPLSDSVDTSPRNHTSGPFRPRPGRPRRPILRFVPRQGNVPCQLAEDDRGRHGPRFGRGVRPTAVSSAGPLTMTA